MGVWGASAVLVTGANRGLGLEFVRLLANIQTCKTIIACCRDPSSAKELASLAKESNKVSIKQLDVTNEQDIQKLAEDLKKELPQKLDLLINNAGTYYHPRVARNQNGIPPSIEGETAETLINTFRVNVVGPFLVTKALIPLLTKEAKNKNAPMSIVFNVTSRMGSIQDNDSGGSYNYRISKTGLNMLAKNFAIDLSHLGILSVACHPGWVLTDMGGSCALIDTKTSVTGMLDRIMELTPKDNGKLIRFDGAPIDY